jgi:N-acetylmuramoyl-L-alanine amidase
LTAIQIQEALPPERKEIDLSEYEGKVMEVNGYDSSGWIYSAKVVEEAGPVLSDFLKSVFCKGTVREKRCALIIGHKNDSPGTWSKNGATNEFIFNEQLIPLIEKKVKNARIYRVYRRTYATLPSDINELAPDFAISLHCNSCDGTASGTEVLYYHKSQQSKDMASLLLTKLVSALGLPDRGIKPSTVEDKGGYLLRYTIAPIVVAEPFFIDNDSDLTRAMGNLDSLAEAYAAAIDEISTTLPVESRSDNLFF